MQKSSIKYLGCELEYNMKNEMMASVVLEKVHARTKYLARIS